MYPIEFLLSPDAAAQRMIERKPKVVVHVELASDRFEELDADDLDHGHRLADNWVTNMRAISAAVRPVLSTGMLGKIDGSIHAADLEDAA
jgi:hypothetical protein